MGIFSTETRHQIWKERDDIKVHPSCNEAMDPKAVEPKTRGYEILWPKRDLSDFATRERTKLKGLEMKLRDSKKWQTVDQVLLQRRRRFRY
jgi:hypothetical protein